MDLKKYSKALVALAGVVAAVGTALPDGIDAQEWGVIGGAVAILIGVFTVKNVPNETGDH